MKSFLLLCDVFSFVFWKKLKTPKRHFEIIWPLESFISLEYHWHKISCIGTLGKIFGSIENKNNDLPYFFINQRKIENYEYIHSFWFIVAKGASGMNECIGWFGVIWGVKLNQREQPIARRGHAGVARRRRHKLATRLAHAKSLPTCKA